MDTALYKKRTLKFTNKDVSRNSRHAETLKARESSRFKRLSMLRSLDEETDNGNNPIEIEKKTEKKKPPSRLEMLMKWKQEKQIKKELDKKNNKRPFYVGGQKGNGNSNMDLPSVAQPSMRFNCSRIAKSRLVPPPSTESVKIVNTAKQQTSSTISQSSRIPNNYKLNGAKAVSQTKANVVSSKNSNTFENSVVSNAKQNSVKAVSQTKANVVSSKNSNTFENSVVSNARQVSALPKPNFSKQSNKAVKTGIPTISSSLPRGISAQRIKNQKTATTHVSKLQEKVTSRFAENGSNKKKEFGLKTAPNKLTGGKNRTTLNTGSEKKVEGKKNDNNIHKKELLSVQDAKKTSSIFDCSISIIKQTSSFAPSNFKFIPPAGLPDFATRDERFETIEANFISRTSTPSKPCQEPSSPVVKVACNDSPSTNNLDSLPKILIPESPIVVKIPCDAEDKVHLTSEKKNEIDPLLISVDASFDLDKIKELLVEHKKLTEEDDKPPKVSEDTCIDSPLNIVDLSNIDDICREPVESIKQDCGLINGKDNLVNRKDMKSPKELESISTDSPLGIIDLNEIKRLSINKELEVLQKKESVNDMDNLVNKRKDTKSSKVLEDVCTDSPLDIIDLNKMGRLSINKEFEVLQEKKSINSKDNVLNKGEDKCSSVSESAHIDSPLQIIDLSKIDRLSINKKLDVLQEEELIDDNLFSEQDQEKCIKVKLSSAPPKRASMLKNVPVLNSIAEIAEPNEHIIQTPKIEQALNPNRRSKRLSKMVIVEETSDSSSAVTPRRSLRLQNIIARKCQFDESEFYSPKSKSNVRRSMRLIDLNTPDKERTDSVCKTNITADFERLCLTEPENINPHACLLDFEYSPVPITRSKKISLLYSPEKTRKSMRKSIRGDLMSFSPSN